MNNLIPGVSLKDLKLEAIDGEKHIEREYTAYARVLDFAWCADAPMHETHEQWSLSYGEDSPIKGRIRLINNRRYTEAVKEPLISEEGHYEVEFDISEDAYEMKKKAAKSGYFKERFSFPIEGTPYKWEVDVFKSKSGGRSDWVKIDLEYGADLKDVPDFPFEVRDLVIDGPDASAETKAAIDLIWGEEWLRLDKQQARNTKI